MPKLRQQLRKIRQQINPVKRKKYACLLAKKIQKIPLKRGQSVAIYNANDGEIDTKLIQKLLENKGVSLYLPILVGKKLKFAKKQTRTRLNRFGIQEPLPTHILPLTQLNIIFMPLVGFDSSKNRLGMGGGFYDRTLSRIQQSTHWKRPKLYGLAFDEQQTSELFCQPWDVPLHKVITPSTFY
jgi:5-formyltetrahydrofolate cyclo-ligase